MKLSELAADIHRRMCEDSRFGYSWYERWGAYSDTWDINGIKVQIQVGDYDCSSSAITAWRLAMKTAGISNPLANATYTGNMRSVFLASGLFQWRTDFANATRGDLYLDEDKHVAMCQGNGKLSEFSISETGGTSGKRGDQTGWESHVTDYRRGTWDGYLHCTDEREVSADKSKVLQLYTSNGTNAQKWRVEWDAKKEWFSLRNVACGLYLDVAGGSGKPKAKVQLYPKNGTDAQKFKLVALSGYNPTQGAPVLIVPKCAPKLVLDVAGAKDADGTSIWTYERNNTTAQHWALLDLGSATWTLLSMLGRHRALDAKGGGK